MAIVSGLVGRAARRTASAAGLAERFGALKAEAAALRAHRGRALGQELGPLERQSLSLLEKGRSKREIAAELGLPSAKVEAIIADLLQRTGTKTRTALVDFAARYELAGEGDNNDEA